MNDKFMDFSEVHRELTDVSTVVSNMEYDLRLVIQDQFCSRDNLKHLITSCEQAEHYTTKLKKHLKSMLVEHFEFGDKVETKHDKHWLRSIYVARHPEHGHIVMGAEKLGFSYVVDDENIRKGNW